MQCSQSKTNLTRSRSLLMSTRPPLKHTASSSARQSLGDKSAFNSSGVSTKLSFPDDMKPQGLEEDAGFELNIDIQVN